jgi:hypothetical protein
MARSTIISISVDHTSSQIGEAVQFAFQLIDPATGQTYCIPSPPNPCPGYDCASDGCLEHPPFNGWSLLTIKVTSPSGVVSFLSPTANFFQGAAGDLRSFNEVGNWTYEVRYEGEYDLSWMRVDNSRYLQSPWASMTFPVYTNQVKKNVAFSNVSLNHTSVPEGGSITISGSLKDTTGAAVPSAQLYLRGSSFVGVEATNFTTNLLGNFSVTVVVCETDPGQCAGPQWLQVVFDGNGLYNPGTSAQLNFTITAGALMDCRPLDSGIVYPPGSNIDIGVALYYPNLTFMVGKSVLVKIINTVTQAVVYSRTITTVNGWWQDNPVISTAGSYEAQYSWAGDGTYLATSCSSDFVVGNCSTPVYLNCSDGTRVMIQDCVGYHLVSTGLSCPETIHKPTILTCQATAINANGDVLAWPIVGAFERLTVSVKNGSGATIYNPLTVKVQDPFGTLWNIQAPYFDYYPTMIGLHTFKVTAAQWISGGVIYDPATCDVNFTVKTCLDGQLSGLVHCDDGTDIYEKVCQNGELVGTGQSCPFVNCRDEHQIPECINQKSIRTNRVAHRLA